MVYALSLGGWYVWEDRPLLTSEPVRITSPVRALTLMAWDVTSSPHISRAISLALHLVNGLLLWAVARSVVSSGAAMLALGIFWLHPVQTESVAYLSARPELIVAFWVLLACWMSRQSVFAAWFLAALAITGKEIGIVAFGLVPLWAAWSGQQWDRLQRLGWALGALGAVAVGLWVKPDAIHPAWWAPAVQLTEAARLLWLLPEALIHPGALTVDHVWTWISWGTISLALTGWTCAFFIAWRWSLSWLSRALVWTLVALSPRLVLPWPDGLHEHHLYPSMPLWAVAIGAAVFPKGQS